MGNALKLHNKDEPYLFEGPIRYLKSLDDFDQATRRADGRVLAIIYHWYITEAKFAFESMKKDYKNLDLYAIDGRDAAKELLEKLLKKDVCAP